MSELLSEIVFGGSSGTGVSYYTTRCPRKATLDKKFPENGGFRAQVGTIFHKMMELYYTGALSSTALAFDDYADFNKDPHAEAQRLFAAYIMYHPADEFTLVASEKKYPETPEQAAIMGALMVDPFTMRIDAIVDFSEEQAERQQAQGKEIVAGRYLLDFKTADKTDNNAGLWYHQDRQFIAYMGAYNDLFPDQRIRGLIARRCVRHMDLHQRLANGRLRSFLDYVIPPPQQEDVIETSRFFRDQQRYLATNKLNFSACRDWGGCPHLLSGNCNQRT